MKPTKSPLTGHAAMIKWNTTWKPHHVPPQFKPIMRRAAIASGTWRAGWQATDALNSDLWDHWGSVVLDGHGIRALVTQPYCPCDGLARAFATRHGLLLTIRCKAPWATGATYYEFTLPPTSLPRPPVATAPI
jgi:hypothetical protein